MSNYARGRKLEYEIKKLFEDNGWDVMRGSSSKGKFAGFKPDLIASRETNSTKREVWAVLLQCKLTGK